MYRHINGLFFHKLGQGDHIIIRYLRGQFRIFPFNRDRDRAIPAFFENNNLFYELLYRILHQGRRFRIFPDAGCRVPLVFMKDPQKIEPTDHHLGDSTGFQIHEDFVRG